MRVDKKTEIEKDVLQAQKEADRRITESEKRSKQIIEELENQTKEIKDKSEAYQVKLMQENEERIELQKAKNFEKISELKKEQIKELKTYDREHFKRKNDQLRQFEKTQEEIEKKINFEKNKIFSDFKKEKEFKELEQKEVLKILEDSHQNRVRSLMRHQDEIRSDLISNHQKELNQKKETLQNLELKTQMNFEERLKEWIETQESRFESIVQETDSKLRDLIQERKQILMDFDDRTKDPFYQSIEIPFEIENNGNSLEIFFEVPKHEIGNFSFTMKDDQLVVLGTRDSKVTKNTPEGIENTYTTQSFSKAILLPKTEFEIKNLLRMDEENGIRIFLRPEKNQKIELRSNDQIYFPKPRNPISS